MHQHARVGHVVDVRDVHLEVVDAVRAGTALDVRDPGRAFAQTQPLAFAEFARRDERLSVGRVQQVRRRDAQRPGQASMLRYRFLAHGPPFGKSRLDSAGCKRLVNTLK